MLAGYGTPAVQIAPRPLGQVLSDAINSLGRVWKPLATTALWVFVPVGAITLAVFRLTGAIEFLDLVLNDPAALQTLPREAFLEAARPFLWASGIAVAIQAIASVFVYIASHRVVAADLAGRVVTGREARSHALGRMPTATIAAVVATVIVTIALGLGIFMWLIPLALVGTPTFTAVLIAAALFVLLAGPGIWLIVSLSMFTSVVSLEPVGPMLSLARSLRLVKGRWWPTLGFLLLVGLLGFVAIQLIQLVAIPLALVGDLGSGVSLASLLGVTAQGLIVAGIGATYTVWYVDLRARNEALASEDLN